MKNGWVVTALCDWSTTEAAGPLEVIVWNDTGTGLIRKGSYNYGSARACYTVAITSFNASTVVTADTNSGTGNIEVSAWQVSSTGSISPLGTTGVIGSPGPYPFVTIAQLDSTRVVTATGSSADTLIVTAWLVPSTGDITAEGSASAAGITETFIAGLNSSQVVTASQDTSGNLAVISWLIDGWGNVTQQGSGGGGSVGGYLSIARWTSSSVATAVTNSTGDLEVISFSVSSTGVVTRQATGTGGIGGDNDLCLIPTDNLPFTAVFNSSGNLSVEVWQNTGPSTLTELATYNTTWPDAPLGVAGISPHKAVTASVAPAPYDLELEVWELEQ